ncbi:hypothetical protein D9M68_750390 [compost metagenome]
MFARGVDATLDTQLAHGVDEAEGRRGHADGTDQAGLVGIDLIRSAGNVIGTGSTQIGNHGIDLDVLVRLAQPANLVIDVAGLHRAAARTVDAQHHTLGLRILEGGTQSGDYVVRTGRLLIRDHSAHFHQSRVLLAARRALLQIEGRREQRQRDEQIKEGQRLEENPPAPGPALLLHASQHRFLQQLPALLVGLVGRRRCFPFIRHRVPPPGIAGCDHHSASDAAPRNARSPASATP